MLLCKKGDRLMVVELIINKKSSKEEIIFLNKVKERLKGYACGYHKELENMINNRIKYLEEFR